MTSPAIGVIIGRFATVPVACGSLAYGAPAYGDRAR